MKKLDELFNQIEFATILTTGRTGSDYLQGCLDNVPGILIFSGHIRFYNFCDQKKINIINYKDLPQVLELFIKENSHLFYKNIIENRQIDLNIFEFKKNFFKIVEEKNLERKKFLFAVYLSYHLTLGRNVENIKTMVHHSHTIKETKRFLKDFQNSKLLITIRDPRANLKSGITNWIKYDRTKESEQHFYFYLKRIRENLLYAQNQTNKKFFIKLEDANKIETKKNLLSFLKVQFNNQVMTATFAGKIWPGDKLSRFSSIKGEYNKSVLNNNWNDFFNKKDKLILNLIYKDYAKFGYEIENINLLKKIYIFFLIPIPFSYEKIIFSIKYNLIDKISIKTKMKNVFFYSIKTLYLYKLLFKFN